MIYEIHPDKIPCKKGYNKTKGHHQHCKKTKQCIHSYIQHQAAENAEDGGGKFVLVNGNAYRKGYYKERLPYSENAAAHQGIKQYQRQGIEKPTQKYPHFHFPCISAA